jgi:hypothetical protein
MTVAGQSIQGGTADDPDASFYLGNDAAQGYLFLSGANYMVRLNPGLQDALALMSTTDARVRAALGRDSNDIGQLYLAGSNGAIRAVLGSSGLTFRDANGNFTGQAAVEKSASVSGSRGYLVLESGLAMCWERKNVTVNINTEWGSLYESAYTYLGSMPYTFGATPAVSVTVEANGQFAFMEGVSDTSVSSWGGTYFCRATSASSVTLTLNLFAIGLAAT